MEDPGAGTIAFLPAMDRFEDFYDTLDISLEAFRDHVNGGGMFNYVEALRSAGIQTVLELLDAYRLERDFELARVRAQGTLRLAMEDYAYALGLTPQD